MVNLARDEVGRLIDSALNLMDRTLLMALYSTGMRNRELRNLQVKGSALASRPTAGRSLLRGIFCCCVIFGSQKNAVVAFLAEDP